MAAGPGFRSPAISLRVSGVDGHRGRERPDTWSTLSFFAAIDSVAQ
jgi:hypothetical protein